MSSIRTWLLCFCAWPLWACASRHDVRANDEADDATSDAVDGAPGSDASPDGASPVDAGPHAGCDSDAPEAAAPDALAPFLGRWTMTATSHQQCAASSLVSPYQTIVRFEQGPADGGAALLFDPDLGCALPMAVEGNVAQLSPAPALCGSLGTPPDLEFTSVQVTLTESSGDITEAVSGGCEYVIHGVLTR